MKAFDSMVRDLGLDPRRVVPFGDGVAKVRPSSGEEVVSARPRGTIVLVTGMTPTPHGEGKTVNAIGLSMALARRGRSTSVVLRQPSLGPVFGVKGGAAGGGRATVEPFVRVNLGLTGDIAAIESAHNLLSAMVDNHVYHGNALGIDPHRIVWPRTLDMNDRSLRRIQLLGDDAHPEAHRSGSFVIAAASEVMAIHGLALGPADLRERLGRIVVASTKDGGPVRAHDLRADGAMAVLLREAMSPNLLQTQEGTPAFVHGGPFGNIAHGTASLASIRLASALTDITVVEAGFGSDLGAEKFVDLVAPTGGLDVGGAVIVATARALRLHGGASLEASERSDVARLDVGLANLGRHVEIVRTLGLEPVVALNRFPGDGDDERRAVRAFCEAHHVPFAESTVFADGGAGALDLAERVEETLGRKSSVRAVYPWESSVPDKVDRVVRAIYGGAGAHFEPAAETERAEADRLGAGSLPICISKTPFSLSDDEHRHGAPTGFTVRVDGIEVHAGAGYTVVHMGKVLTMPGLPLHPAAEAMDLGPDGEVLGIH